MRLTPRVALALVVGGLLILAGIAYLGTLSTGTVVVFVRDAPSNWSRLDVTFSEVAFHRADAGNESGWVPLQLATTTIDFMKLGNLTKLLAMDRIPAGMYTQLRIIVSSVFGTMTGGSPLAFVVPDGILKTARPFEVKGGATATVTLDFDLARSIHPDGETWIFTPVLGSVVVG